MAAPDPLTLPPDDGHRRPWHRVFVGIGSNLGDKMAHCRQALQRLAALTDVRLVATSRFYRTAPVDYTDQDWFVNAAILIETRLDPHGLLGHLKAMERAFGRLSGGRRFGPRPIDLDIVFYGNWILDRDGLQIPHPRMHKRRFVLQPICDIDPAFVHPVFNQSVRYLLDKIQDPDQEVFPLI